MNNLMMKAWLGILLFGVLSCCWADQGGYVKNVQTLPGPKELGAKRVIDTREGLLVTLDSLGITNALLTEEQKKVWKAKLGLIKVFSQLSVEGLAAMPEVFKIIGNKKSLDLKEAKEALKPINGLLKRLTQATDDLPNSNDPDAMAMAERISKAMDRVKKLDGEGPTFLARQIAAEFQEVSLIAAELRQEIMDLSQSATVTLAHQRDNDQSRRREVSFLEPLTDSDLKIWAKVKDFYTNSQKGDVEQLKNSLIKQTKDLALGAVDKIKGEVDTSIKDLETKWKTLVGKYGKDNPKIKDAMAGFDAVKHTIDSIIAETDDISILLNRPNSSLTNDSIKLFSSSAGLLCKDIDTLVGLVKVFGVAVKKLTDGIADELVADIATLCVTAQTHFNKLVNDARTQILGLPGAVLSIYGLANQMIEVGRMAHALSNDGVIRYDNMDGILVSSANSSGEQVKLSQRLVTGDELLLSVTANKTGVPLVAERFYVYKQGWYTDRLFSLAFVQKDDEKSWRFFPNVSDVFKRGSRNIEANRLWSVGIGLSLSLLDQNGDDAMEIGVAPTLSFLDDRLLVGFGLNTSTNKSYLLVGYRIPIRN